VNETNEPRAVGTSAMLWRWACLAALAGVMTGCAKYSRQSEFCQLLIIAYDEQNELAPGWYDSAAVEIKRCGFIIEHRNGQRGFGPDGYVNGRNPPTKP
jgi:hypothetical protein